jgi:hypothetical protein
MMATQWTMEDIFKELEAARKQCNDAAALHRHCSRLIDRQHQLIMEAINLLRDAWQFEHADSALKRDEWLKNATGL